MRPRLDPHFLVDFSIEKKIKERTTLQRMTMKALGHGRPHPVEIETKCNITTKKCQLNYTISPGEGGVVGTKLTLHRLRLAIGAFLGGISNVSSSATEQISPSPAEVSIPPHSSSYLHLAGGESIAGEMTTRPQILAAKIYNTSANNRSWERKRIEKQSRERNSNPLPADERGEGPGASSSSSSFSSLS